MKAAAVAVFVGAAAAALPALSVKTVAKSVYANIDRAFVERSVTAVDIAMRSHVTKDFAAVAGGRSLTYAQLLVSFRGIFADFRRVRSSTSVIVSSKVAGRTATLRVKGTLVALGSDRDGKVHTVELLNLSEDVWKLVAGQWKWASSTTLSQTTRIDGTTVRPVPHINPRGR